MTQERFLRIVEDPQLLRNITYEELKTLALAYPYAHNLRYLLAIKARQIDHPEVVKNVATAAAYSLDRVQLFRLVAPQMIAPQEVWIEEEVLELKPIETLKRKLEEELLSANTKSETTQLEAAETAPAPTDSGKTRVETVAPIAAEPEEIPIELPHIPYQTYAEWMAKFRPPLLGETIAPAPAPPEPAVEEEPESVDDSDLDGDEFTKTTARERVKTTGLAQRLAEKSIAENKDVISETLAKLYAKQGYREKAISMYERLGLAFPEKSAYFAAEIDKLKK